jgi:hypothetical protein
MIIQQACGVLARKGESEFARAKTMAIYRL